MDDLNRSERSEADRRFKYAWVSEGSPGSFAPPAHPRRQAIVSSGLLGIFLLVLIIALTPARDFILAAFHNQPVVTPHDRLFYILSSVNGSSVTIDNKRLSQLPDSYVRPGLLLSRGTHSLVWHAFPFKDLHCTIEIPAARLPTRDCPYEVAADTEPPGHIINFAPTLNDLAPSAHANLVAAIEAQLGKLDSTENVFPGERYAAPKSASNQVQMTIAHHPLQATFNVHLDTNPHSGRICIGLAGDGSCSLLQHDCHLFCSFQSPSPAQEHIPPIDGSRFHSYHRILSWLQIGLIYSNWTYRDLQGQIVAENAPDTVQPDNTTADFTLSLQADWDGYQWHVTLFFAPNPPHKPSSPILPIPENVDASCLLTSLQINGNPTLLQTPDGQPLVWTPITSPTRAQGCLEVGHPGGQPDSTPAYLLYRFGILLAANPLAHHYFPTLPQADAYEQKLAHQIYVDWQSSSLE